MENSRWPPGGNIGSLIMTKIDRAPPKTHTLIPPKYEINWVRGSQVMERNVNECKIQDGHLAYYIHVPYYKMYYTLGCELSFQNVTLRSSWLKCYDWCDKLPSGIRVMEDQILFTMYYVIQGYIIVHYSMKCEVERTALSRGYINCALV
jgi:hypothetical protein